MGGRERARSCGRVGQANEALEEAREVERRHQQALIETFDRLMHVFGTWEVEALVDRFLTKAEHNGTLQRYREALDRDAIAIQGEIRELNAARAAAADLASRDDEQGPAVRALRDRIAATTRRAADYQVGACAPLLHAHTRTRTRAHTHTHAHANRWKRGDPCVC